ncbi:hypothetical protein [Bacteroides sp.]
MKQINIVILFCCLLAGKMSAQPAYKATLPAVHANAFYAIDLPHQVVGAAAPDFADIRIVDNNNKEVAWLLQEDVRSGYDSEFVPFQTTITTSPRRTHLLVETNGNPLSSFVLNIKNADVEKEASLRGSNDGKKWFAVKEFIRLNNISSVNQTVAFLDINFPLSDYKFYKMDIIDSLSAPLNIIAAGRMKDESFYERKLLDVPVKNIRMQEKGKSTEIELTYPFQYPIERLSFFISSPQYFNRAISVVKPAGCPWSSTLSHGNGNPQSLSLGLRTSTLKLSISNGDDQPLNIDSIKTYIRKYYLVAALKEGIDYTLTYGDRGARFPQYDLSFSQQLPDSLEHITVKNFEEIPQIVVQPEVPSPWMVFLKKYGIWLIIAVIIIQILLMVKKLLK